MSIISFINRISVQTAVYWGNPVNNGYGRIVYDEPEEILCRWDEKLKIINNTKGEEVISNAEILTNEILEEGGVLFLGSLNDIEDSSIPLESWQVYPQPYQLERTHRVLTVDKIPLIRSNSKFVYVYYLKPNWEQKL